MDLDFIKLEVIYVYLLKKKKKATLLTVNFLFPFVLCGLFSQDKLPASRTHMATTGCEERSFLIKLPELLLAKENVVPDNCFSERFTALKDRL